MKLPLVSVIIPTYRDWTRLKLCIKALEKQTYPKELIEIIVVNNAYDDETPQGFKIPENCRIIVEKERGSYAARNTGIKLSSGEILAFTDSDCIPDIDWVKNVIKHFEEHPNVSRIGGKVQLFYSASKPNLAEAYDTVYAFRQELYVIDGGAVTANMIAKKSVFDKIGFFDSNMYSGGDNEWGHRASSQGFKIIYASDVVVKHPARVKIGDLIRKARRVSSGLRLVNNQSGTDKYLKLFRLVVIPPIGEFKNIFSKRFKLSFSKRISVFFLRYYILLIRSYEVIKLHHGAKPFKDSV